MYSGLAHAAIGGMMNRADENEENVMYEDGYTTDQQSMSTFDSHPCARLWEQFQSCVQMNSSDISSCQMFYDMFNRCQQNPNGMCMCICVIKYENYNILILRFILENII